MGNRNSTTMKRRQIAELVKLTHFEEMEVQQIQEHFKRISESVRNDGVIDKEEFRKALGLRDNLFADRLFDLFDENGDRTISMQEFCVGLSIFSKKGTLDEKLRFSFDIYDIDGDGSIDKDELFKILKASLFDNGLNLTEAQMRAAVDATFAEADTDNNGKISFDEYKRMVLRHPGMIKNMTISTPGLE